MTREEFKKKVDKISCYLSYPTLDDLHEIDDHDAEQRQVIEQLKARLDLVGKDFTANMVYQGQLEKCNADLMQQIAMLREALEWDGLVRASGHAG